jgi:hypothetical protein
MEQLFPFYFDFGENKTWYPDLAIKFRTPQLIKHPLSLEKIREFGVTKSIEPLIEDVDFMLQNKEVGGSHGLMWDIACHAPHRFADLYDQRILVILDEFQYRFAN